MNVPSISSKLAPALLALALLLFQVQAKAQVETVLHSFQAGQTISDGAAPHSNVIQGSDGNFYGTTYNGGSGGAYAGGTVFKQTPAGVVTILHSFGDGSVANDGTLPWAGLVEGTDGNFYGTTPTGGLYDLGTAYRITPAGVLTVLHSFGNGTDGISPYANLIQATDGNFYGTTDEGGGGNLGTVYVMTPAGVVTTLKSFGDGTPSNGDGPYYTSHVNSSALVQGPDGSFYGTTYSGGPPKNGNLGTIFRITPGGTFDVGYAFKGGTNGGHPLTALTVGSDGNFYGTTPGTIFRITPTWVLKTLHTFGSVPNDGTKPEYAESLIQGTDGNFYGTTNKGGAANYGVVYRMTPAGAVTILHSFGDGSIAGDGTSPLAGLVQGSDGAFYGTTTTGGVAQTSFYTSGYGALYKITSAGIYTLTHSFQAPTSPKDGAAPYTGLVQGSDGNFYGTTEKGGTTSHGTVFRMTPGGATNLLHSFQDGSVANDGASPVGQLVVGADGNFYGATLVGGAGNAGAVYKISPSGVVSILHSFNGTDGDYPQDGLTLGPDGNFYGTTGQGGAGNHGTIFKVTPAGVFTSLFVFGGGPSAGFDPYGLVEGPDGNFYGVTNSGGQFDAGTAFRVTPDGDVTYLHQFKLADGTGAFPRNRLALGVDGNFYGICGTGADDHSNGGVFKVTPAGVVTSLHTFSDGSVANDGSAPEAGLTLLADGNFAGTTYYGGASGFGTVYEITPAGVETILYSFNYGTDGVAPLSPVIEDANGILFGTASGGGVSNQGIVYKIAKSVQKITFTTIGDHLVSDPPFTISATSSAGLTPVTFRVVSGPATVFGNTVTLTGAPGTVTIEATQAGNATYRLARTSQFFNVKAPQTINFPPIGDQPFGVKYTLTATATSGIAVHYAVVFGPATLSGKQLTFTGVGAVTITASQPGSSSYLPAPDVTQTFNVVKGPQTISFPGVATVTWPTSTVTLNAKASSGLPITYSVSGGGATVSGNVITIAQPGTINVTARQAGNANYLAAEQVSIRFSVDKTPQTITFPAVGTVTVGQTVTLGASASSGLPISYSVASGTATISGNQATFTTAGTVRILATQPGDTYTAAANSIAINVSVR